MRCRCVVPGRTLRHASHSCWYKPLLGFQGDDAAVLISCQCWQRGNELIQIFFFVVEFSVGICMFIIVTWLLLFRLTEIKECWKIHARIRFYFGLTLVGTAVNLGIGICGTVNLSVGFK